MRSSALWRRLTRMTVQAVVTMAIVILLVFLLVRLIPGDPAKVILGVQYSPDRAAALEADLRLDRSLPEQLSLYAQDLARGDLGESNVQRGRSVTDIVFSALPTTLAVSGAGIVIGVTAGMGLGIVAAATRRRGVDLAIRTWSMLSFAVPTFLSGLILILVVSLRLGWLPAGGWPNSWPENFRYLILPGIALAGPLVGIVSRTVRQAAIDVQREQHMEAASLRGLPSRRITVHHLLPNSTLPVLSIIGISFGTLLTGAIVVESVFGIPGLGAEMTRAVTRRDYPVIQGITLVTGLLVVISGYVVEVAYALVDPRARTL